MKIDIYRYQHGLDSTLGLLFVNGIFRCYTCEDEYREQKLAGETRIPEGTYSLVLRDEGNMIKRYQERFSHERHPGMLWLLDVPDFKYVYIHVGNTEKDTDGCILVGNQPSSFKESVGGVYDSASAYISLYRTILAAIDAAEPVTVTVRSL